MENTNQNQQPVPQSAPPSTPPSAQPSVAMQIQQIIVQQQQYQQQYNHIVAYLKQNPTQSPEQIAQIKTQLDQLNAAYLQGQEALKALGYNPVQVNKPAEVKKGAKINFSPKKLAIGCGFLIAILVLGFGGGLYFLIKNPNALTSVGITAATAKTLFSTFAGLFFGVIILLGLGTLLANIARLITVKNQSKKKYILRLLGGLLLLGIGGGGIGFVFSKIALIETEVPLSPTQVVFPYLVGKGDKEFLYQGNHILIAPSEFAFVSKISNLNNYASKNLGQVTLQGLTLFCWNKTNQILSYDAQKEKFNGRCLYDQKGEYSIEIEITYINQLTNERLTHTLNAGKLTFGSEITLSLANTQSNAKSSRLLATQGEFILGKAPTKITIDTTSIFRDFNLKEYKVVRDMEGKEVTDRENLVVFDYIYKLPKVYYPTVKFPELGDFIYQFPVRVEQSDVPICDILLSKFSGTKYKIQTTFLDGSASHISSYNYSIIDQASKKALETFKQTTRELDYTFPNQGSYVVALDFITIDGKKGNCESDTLVIAEQTLDINYRIKQKFIEDKEFTVIPPTEYAGGTLKLTRIPQALQIELVAITPNSPALEQNVFVDNRAILNEGTHYNFEITEERAYDIRILAEDKDKQLRNEIPLTILVERPDIVGELIISPNDGYEPLIVTLDASRTTLNVPGDEIIYFTRDFGDGEIKKNLTNAVISHTYKYDYDKENGAFLPKVSITTKKGLQTEIVAPQKVLVKKQLVQIEISTPSHPTQIAKAGDPVGFLAEFNRLPEKMIWNFGDGSEPYQCKRRECTEVTKTYLAPGSYSILLTLEFDDMQSVDSVIEMKIN